MLLRNHAARLITVNGVSSDGVVESFKVLPGNNPPTEVPDKYCKSDFVKHLLKAGELSVVQADEEEEDDTAGLKEQAEALGIKVDKRWGADRIRSEIEKAQTQADQ